MLRIAGAKYGVPAILTLILRAKCSGNILAEIGLSETGPREWRLIADGNGLRLRNCAWTR